jgi:hypothetical protein
VTKPGAETSRRRALGDADAHRRAVVGHDVAARPVELEILSPDRQFHDAWMIACADGCVTTIVASSSTRG